MKTQPREESLLCGPGQHKEENWKLKPFVVE